MNFVGIDYLYVKFYTVILHIIILSLVILFIHFGRRISFYGCIQVVSFATLCKDSWPSSCDRVYLDVDRSFVVLKFAVSCVAGGAASFFSVC